MPLWFYGGDEIEKALGKGNGGDSGTSQRILGHLLSWIAERENLIYIYFTANSLAALPPELLRAGRLDKIFFIDHPKFEECKEILRIHLRRNSIIVNDLDIEHLATLMHHKQFTGAEIELSIINANFKAAAEALVNNKMGSTNVIHIEAAAKEIKTFMASNKEYIDAMREEAIKKYESSS